MIENLDPTVISLLIPTEQQIKNLKGKEVSVPDIFIPSTKELHPDGLYSTSIFGLLASDERQKTFGYIPLHVPILHPVIYRSTIALKQLYKEIMSGKTYAVWDSKTSDFERSSPEEGDTGYEFFMKHYTMLDFKRNKSKKRDESINFLQKYQTNNTIKYLLVLPAGIRDIELKDNGSPEEDEINSLYRKVLSQTSLIPDTVSPSTLKSLDNTRWRMHEAIFELYTYLESKVGNLNGTKMYISRKFGSRVISHCTDNVITAAVITASSLDDPRLLDPNATQYSLLQFIVGNLPTVIFHLKETFMSNVFPGQTAPAKLIDTKSLNNVPTHVTGKVFNSFMSQEGLTKLIHKFKINDIRHNPVMVDGKYLYLIYKDDKYFMLLQDIDDLPEGYDTNKVYPITYTELFYIACYKWSNEVYGFNSRYPITKEGSIFPSVAYLRTTLKTQQLKELDIQQNEIGNTLEFPIKDHEFYNSMSVPLMNESNCGADHDGDSRFC